MARSCLRSGTARTERTPARATYGSRSNRASRSASLITTSAPVRSTCSMMLDEAAALSPSGVLCTVTSPSALATARTMGPFSSRTSTARSAAAASMQIGISTWSSRSRTSSEVRVSDARSRERRSSVSDAPRGPPDATGGLRAAAAVEGRSSASSLTFARAPHVA